MAENLKSKIAEDRKNALKSGNSTRLSTLRMLTAAITSKEIELRKKDVGLSDEEVLGVIAAEAKKRKDSVAEYAKGGREDLAKKEEAELKILQEYLPPELPDDELLRVILAGIREAGAKSEADFGKVMKIVMPTLKNKASGDRISATLRRELKSKHD